MARMRKIKGGEEFSALLNQLGDGALTVMKKALYEGAGVLADAVKAEIRDLPQQSGYMREGKKRNVVGSWDKAMLEQHLGISRIEATGDKASVAISFAGYNNRPTKKYPNGVPIPLIARSIESGSSIREKNPFIRRAYNKAKSEALRTVQTAGEKALSEQIK